MLTPLISLINLLDTSQISNSGVIDWGSPVPSFGDISCSRVATLGLNPSNREFLDEGGNELVGKFRRFHTLKSLSIASWSEVDFRHLTLISESCKQYFYNNPYDRWFKILDKVISGTGASYYSKVSCACHLDLIPYATLQKWNELSLMQRSTLLSLTGDSLGLLVRDSPIKIIILNGSSVVKVLQDISSVQLERQSMPSWSLPRHTNCDVMGVAYYGVTDTLAGVQLGRDLLVLGFNHNLQSSFGVTTMVLKEIQKWVCQATKEFEP